MSVACSKGAFAFPFERLHYPCAKHGTSCHFGDLLAEPMGKYLLPSRVLLANLKALLFAPLFAYKICVYVLKSRSFRTSQAMRLVMILQDPICEDILLDIGMPVLQLPYHHLQQGDLAYSPKTFSCERWQLSRDEVLLTVEGRASRRLLPTENCAKFGRTKEVSHW